MKRYLLLLAILTGIFTSPLYSQSGNQSFFDRVVSERITDPESSLGGIQENQTSRVSESLSDANTKNSLELPLALNVSEFPWLAEAAIADYREAIRKDFIDWVGRADGYIDASGLATLASRQRLAFASSASDYLSSRDKDKDNRLTLEEFVPSAAEIAEKVDLQMLVANFSKGLPYSTGQNPIASASAFGLKPAAEGLYTTPTEIEQRIEVYASAIGGSTFRRPDGRLGAKDASGKIIDPLPPEVVPLWKMHAEKILQDFVGQKGGQAEFFPDSSAVLRDGSGNIIPMEKWPPYTQPPYHPEEKP